MIFLIYILLVVGPVFGWLWFFRYKDRFEPEPWRLILKVLFIGGFVAIAISVLSEYVLDVIFFSEYDIYEDVTEEGFSKIPLSVLLISTIISVVIEEFSKYLILIHGVYFNKNFNQIKDGVIYGVTLGLGFAFFENTFYFFDYFGRGDDMIQMIGLALSRTIGPLMMHFVTAGIIGFYLGKKKFTATHKKSLAVKGLLIAICVHFLYNSVIIFFQSIIIGILIVVIGLVFLLREIRKDDNRMVWKFVKK